MEILEENYLYAINKGKEIRGTIIIKVDSSMRRKERKWCPRITACIVKLQPTQGYAQAYGQQSYRTCGQPTDVSFTQAQITATYGQTTYATSYGTASPRYTTPAASQAYSLHCMALVLMIPTAIVTTIQAFCAPQSAYGTQPAYPVYRQQPTATEPVKPQDSNKSAETSQSQFSTRGYNEPRL